MKKLLFKAEENSEDNVESSDGVFYDPKKRTISIRGEITPHDGMDFDLIIDELIHNENDELNFKPITIRINSSGGDVRAGLDIISQIEHYKQKGLEFHGLCEEFAYSMAFLIFISCNVRKMRKYANIMFHPSYRQFPEGYVLTISEVKNILREMKEDKKNFTDIVLRNTKIPKKKVSDIYKYDYDYFMNAKEALKFGCIDEII